MKSPFIQQVFLIAYYVPVPGLIVKVHGQDSAVPTLSRPTVFRHSLRTQLRGPRKV